VNACGFRKLLPYLLAFLAAFAQGAASPFGGTIALAGSDTAPPAESQAKPEEVIQPKVGFVLQRSGDRWEPVLHYSHAFRLPGTNMRFGPYIYFTPEDEDIGVPRTASSGTTGGSSTSTSWSRPMLNLNTHS
jgi:hypothetical protein